MAQKKYLVLGLVLLCVVVVIITVGKMNSRPLKRREERRVVLPTLVIACSAAFVERSLRSLTYFRRNPSAFPIIVYNDRGSSEINETVDPISARDPTITLLQNPNPENNRQLRIPLDHVFGTLMHEAVIVLDDNLDISPDFFEYFLATYHVMQVDRSIWCVSAWNDNCKKDLIDINKPHLLHRTDSFPGNGWMIQYETWEEIEPHLDITFDAESLHDVVITHDRVCIRPEISRTYRFGVCNKNIAQIEDLRHIPRNQQRELNIEFMPFTGFDLSYLLKEYDHFFLSLVYLCEETTLDYLLKETVNSSTACVRISYSNPAMFRMIANAFGLMTDYRHGVPRTSLHGIVQCFAMKRRVYLVPANDYMDNISNASSKTSKTVRKTVYS